MCEVQCAGWDLQRRATERKKGQSWRVAGGVYLEVTGGTNKNQKVPHLEEGVCLLIHIHHRSVSVALPHNYCTTPLLPTIQHRLPSFPAPFWPATVPFYAPNACHRRHSAVHVNRAEPPPQNTIHHFTLELGSPATKHWLAAANPIHHTRILCSSHSPLLTCGLW